MIRHIPYLRSLSVVDADGNSLIDLGSGIAVVNVGNAAPAVAQAVAAQAAAFLALILATSSSQPSVRT